MNYGLILTDIGAAAIEAAYQAGTVVSIPTVSFGDGGGQPVTADPAVTQLAGRLGPVPLTAGEVGPVLLGGVGVVPCREYPGKVLREFGLEAEDGTLIAYGAYPDTYLPSQEDSIVKELVVKFIMPLVHADCVTLVIDPNVAVLTIAEADKRYYQQSLRLQEIMDAGPQAQTEARLHLDIYSREECDNRYQPKGDYTPAGEAYTKTESDNRFLNADENLGDVPDKGAARSNLEIYSREECDQRYAPAGSAYTKAESDARYLQDSQLGARVHLAHVGDLVQTPPGCVVVSLSGDSDTDIEGYYAPLQKLINGAWVTVGG